eukprot:CAMPEP_0204825738 /NCGR_PEP_ID=MMETSP1346-20131115/3552_1 /ASSEMBLY_ACC=CAM_ASM_000771 /TAXON_ID=215587 /ORGANISM="Aplanochytrium stocchinoi, Strain GSBS06" /LENGTH=802 /DNA_ID=CAMNT_0051953457 /DNA_START=106 /DNA_END=2514 /DNA_ORIENTATION=+
MGASKEGGGLMARTKKKGKNQNGNAKKRKELSDNGSDASNKQEREHSGVQMKKRKRDFGSLQKTWKLSPGTIVVGRLSLEGEKNSSGYVLVKVAPSLSARLCLTHIDDSENWVDSPLTKLKNKQFVKCRLLNSADLPNNKDDFLYVSLRPSLVNEDSAENGQNDEGVEEMIEEELKSSTKLPAVGQLVKGFVVGTSKHGCFVRLTRYITALVQLRNLSDSYVEDVSKYFPLGKLVAGRVIHTNPEKHQVTLSLKSTSVIGSNTKKWTWENIKPGMKLPGRVRRCEKYGVLINLEDSERLGGLCYRTEIEDNVEIKDASKAYSQGDRVLVKVLSIDKIAKKISLGLKPSYFRDDEDTDMKESEIEASEKENDSEEEEDEKKESDSEEEEDENEDAEKECTFENTRIKGLPVLGMVEEGEEESDEEIEEVETKNVQENNDGEDDEGSEDDSDESSTEASKHKKLTLQDMMKSSSKQSNDEDSDDDDDDEDDDGFDALEKEKETKSSKSRKRNRMREEALLAEKEKELADGKDIVETADDFERELVSSSDSSMLWIRYMAFQIAQTEIDQARRIAERALQTINFREEEEKQNVWIAYLKIEYKYGTEESVNSLFKRVVQHWDAKHANYALAEIYADGKDYEKADLALKKAVKASKGMSRGAWLRRIVLKMDSDKADEARALLQEAIRALPKRKHIRTLMEFARCEYSKNSGSSERGRTVCEGLLSSYPKRTDVWHQYIDVEQKYGDDKSRVRKLFERVITVKMSVKKIKAFFKKWLTFEQEFGSEALVEEVKAKAREYVAGLAGN